MSAEGSPCMNSDSLPSPDHRFHQVQRETTSRVKSAENLELLIQTTRKFEEYGIPKSSRCTNPDFIFCSEKLDTSRSPSVRGKNEHF